MSANTGFTTGGTNLTITGSGFETGDVAVMVDQTVCDVTQRSKGEVSCTIKPQTAASALGEYAGQHGVSRKFINDTVAMTDLETAAGVNLLGLTWEAPYKQSDSLGNLYQGWFVAPATTRYRFYISCDDDCELWHSATADDSSAKAKILELTWAMDHRQYWIEGTNGNVQASAWISMNAGDKHYLEGRHIEGSGHDHFTVSVEIEHSAKTDHHMAVKEVQEFQIDTDQTFEKHRFTVMNPDSGEFVIFYMNTKNFTNVDTKSVKANANAGNFRAAIKDFFSGYFGSDINVVLEMYDAADALTTDAGLSVKNVYTVELRKLVSGQTHSAITIAKTSTSAQISTELPEAV